MADNRNVSVSNSSILLVAISSPGAISGIRAEYYHKPDLTPAEVRRNEADEQTVAVSPGKRPVGDRDKGHQHSQRQWHRL